jgi:hypothetical protein
MRIRRLAIIMMAVVLALGVVGCKSAAEEIVEDATGVDVEGDTVTITDDEGGEVTVDTGGKTLPDGFPSDFPIPAGAEIMDSMSVTMGDQPSQWVTLAADGTVREVYDWYASALPDAGYEIGEYDAWFIEADDGDAGALRAVKGTTEVNVNVSTETEGEAIVSIAIGVVGD